MSQSQVTSVLREDWAVRLSKIIWEGFRKGGIAIIGIGNPLKSDDYVGSMIAKDLSKVNALRKKVKIIDAENSPENILSHLQDKRLALLIDSLDTGHDPGSISLVDLSQTTYPFFASHNIPLKLLLEPHLDAPQAFLIGVQPGNLDFGEMLSKEVQKARATVVRELSEIFRGLGGDAIGD